MRKQVQRSEPRPRDADTHSCSFRLSGFIRITLPALEAVTSCSRQVPGGRPRSGAGSVSPRARPVSVPPRRPAAVSVVPCVSSRPGNLVAFYCTRIAFRRSLPVGRDPQGQPCS